MDRILQKLRPYIRRRKVLLKSGASSDWYVDVKASCGDPELLALFARELSRRIPPETTCVAASGYGGLALASAVSLRTGLSLAMVRETRKAHGTKSWIEGHIPGLGDRVAVIDDVFTSGTGMGHIERIIRRTKASIAGRFVVVDRSESGTARVSSLVWITASLLKAEEE